MNAEPELSGEEFLEWVRKQLKERELKMRKAFERLVVVYSILLVVAIVVSCKPY